MTKLCTLPKNDGFRMPGEFEPHHGTIMIFPERPGSWHHNAGPALPAFLRIYRTIAAEETLYLLVSRRMHDRAVSLLKNIPNVRILTIPNDDAWARDTAPTFVRNASGEVRGIDWKFNAWGGAVDGLYADYAQDNALASALCQEIGIPCYDAQHFVLEGGSIHSDGQGTILTTASCLLSKGRNPHLNRTCISQMLCDYLGGEKVIWLPRGIYNDETNEHVDNMCVFLCPGEVVLAWTEDEEDPQYALSHASYEALVSQTDAKGRHVIVHKLPIPEHPVCITEADLQGFEFAEGENVREIGERLAASYVNFYFTNRSVLLPQFGGTNAESDALAVSLMQQWTDRRIVPIPARELLLGGGNIHCLTQQIPEGVNLCEM